VEVFAGAGGVAVGKEESWLEWGGEGCVSRAGVVGIGGMVWEVCVNN